MFRSGLKVGAHGDERVEVIVGSERAADLVVDLDHSQGSLGEVVRERDGCIDEASKDLVLFVPQTTGEVVGLALPGLPTAGSPPAWRRAGRAQCERGRDGLVVVGSDRRRDLGRYSSFPGVGGDLGGGTRREETLPNGCRPRLVGVYLGR